MIMFLQILEYMSALTAGNNILESGICIQIELVIWLLNPCPKIWKLTTLIVSLPPSRLICALLLVPLIWYLVIQAPFLALRCYPLAHLNMMTGLHTRPFLCLGFRSFSLTQSMSVVNALNRMNLLCNWRSENVIRWVIKFNKQFLWYHRNDCHMCRWCSGFEQWSLAAGILISLNFVCAFMGSFLVCFPNINRDCRSNAPVLILLSLHILYAIFHLWIAFTNCETWKYHLISLKNFQWSSKTLFTNVSVCHGLSKLSISSKFLQIITSNLNDLPRNVLDSKFSAHLTPGRL